MNCRKRSFHPTSGFSFQDNWKVCFAKQVMKICPEIPLLQHLLQFSFKLPRSCLVRPAKRREAEGGNYGHFSHAQFFFSCAYAPVKGLMQRLGAEMGVCNKLALSCSVTLQQVLPSPQNVNTAQQASTSCKQAAWIKTEEQDSLPFTEEQDSPPFQCFLVIFLLIGS